MHQAHDPALTRVSPTVRLRGVALAAACTAIFGATVWLDLIAPDGGPGVVYAVDSGWPFALNGVLLGLLAMVVLLGPSSRVFGWLLGALGVFWALDGLAQGYIRAGVRTDEVWPAMTFAVWFLERFGVFLPISIIALLLVFPTGRFLPGAWGVVGRVTLTVAVACGLLVLVVPAEDRTRPAELPASIDIDPTSIGVLGGHAEVLHPLTVGLATAAFAVSLLLVVVRYRQSRGLMRDRMRWLLWSAVVIAAYELVTLVLVDVDGTDFASIVVAMVLPGAAMTAAIVRPALLPIQDVLGRTVVLAAVLVALVAADVVVLALLTAVLDDELTQAQVVAVVLAVAVLLYGPLRQRLASAMQRLVLGDRGNRYDAVAGLASTLETTDETGEQLAAVARAVAAAFGVAFVSVEVDRSHGERLVTTYGDRPEQVRTLPITYRGVGVGRLVLPARGLRSRLTVRDEELLGDLVRQAAAAARTSQLAEEVQRSRERLVAAREEERRRIRRDLHDGFGPALSGIVFQLEAARMTIERDPAAARDQLEAVSAHVQDVVADVRRLVHDLRPPALDDRGLVGALRQQADLLDLPVEVEAADDLEGRLPAAVEVAAYRIAGEALTNVVRHAGATHATVVLGVTGDDLHVEVVDDGVGIAADRQAGVGLVSLRERAAELGGTTEITCPAHGGTVVRAVLPMRSPA